MRSRHDLSDPQSLVAQALQLWLWNLHESFRKLRRRGDRKLRQSSARLLLSRYLSSFYSPLLINLSKYRAECKLKFVGHEPGAQPSCYRLRSKGQAMDSEWRKIGFARYNS